MKTALELTWELLEDTKMQDFFGVDSIVIEDEVISGDGIAEKVFGRHGIGFDGEVVGIHGFAEKLLKEMLLSEIALSDMAVARTTLVGK